jgi:hypothetical protein
MCFSARSSILSFTIGLLGSLLCLSLGSVKDRIIGYFFGFVSLMQGIEYLLWTHQKCDNYNRLISLLGMSFNHLQPFVLGIIILLINKNVNHKPWIYLVMFLYVLIIVPYSLQFFSVGKDKQCTLKNTANHLQWNWNILQYNRLIYIIFLLTMSVLFILGMPTMKTGLYFALGAILSYITSAIVYNYNDVGALWCYYVAFLPIIYFVLHV